MWPCILFNCAMKFSVCCRIFISLLSLKLNKLSLTDMGGNRGGKRTNFVFFCKQIVWQSEFSTRFFFILVCLFKICQYFQDLFIFSKFFQCFSGPIALKMCFKHFCLYVLLDENSSVRVADFLSRRPKFDFRTVEPIKNFKLLEILPSFLFKNSQRSIFYTHFLVFEFFSCCFFFSCDGHFLSLL